MTSLPYETFDKKRLELSEAPAVNELGRLPENPVKLDVVEAGQPLNLNTQHPTPNTQQPVKEAGYDYAVSFDIDCATEANGTILTTGENATFYLADPETGRLAFSRDGYLNKFNYKLPETGRVTIRVEGTNAETRLFVNNRHRETLRKRDAYSVGEPLNTMPDAPYHTTVYVPTRRMFYVATLVFPLEKAGNFKSRVTNLEVRKL